LTAYSVITPAELRHTMESTGMPVTDDDTDEMIREADTDGDGAIDYDGQSLP